MTVFLQIFAFLFAIGLLVTLHELGHFWMARLIGVKVLCFSVGFGKPLWRRISKSGTEYIVAMIPLGGYVKMLDGREQSLTEQEKPYAFDHKPLLGRIAVVCMGPVMNFLIAIVAFWLIFFIGIHQVKPIIGKVLPNSIAAHAGLQPDQQFSQVDNYATPNWTKVVLAVVLRMGESGNMQVKLLDPKTKTKKGYSLNLNNWQVNGLNPDPLGSLGIVPYEPPIAPIIEQIANDSPAQHAGLRVGDKVLQVNNRPIHDWLDFVKYIQQRPNQALDIKIQRDQQILEVNAFTSQKHVGIWKIIGYFGLGAAPVKWPPGMEIMRRYSFWGAWVPAWQETVDFTVFNAKIIGKMVIGQLSLKGLGGPITIFTSSSTALKQGLISYISFLAIFSLMLGFVNILPIPGLDGGHLLYFLIEAFRGKPLKMSTQILIWRIGIAILILLMFQAIMNDVLRLF
ncbi:MAG: RIP metalloprotease RseP [Gammaproteobacteria bacterium]